MTNGAVRGTLAVLGADYGFAPAYKHFLPPLPPPTRHVRRRPVSPVQHSRLCPKRTDPSFMRVRRR
eukprot:6535397-Prymnesium_polylepis.1